MIRALYAALSREFDGMEWWPSGSPFETVVGAILVQQTRWESVEKVILSLKERGLLTPEAMSATPLAGLEELIRPAGFYRQKAARLKRIAEYFLSNPDAFSLSTGDLRRELLGLPGVGEETADAVLLFAAGKPSFVIDAYTRRTLRCMGIHGDYRRLQGMFEEALPRDVDVYRKYHGFLIEHGKRYCNRKKCGDCAVTRLAEQKKI
jgi:endonuclease III related protein